MPRFTDVQLTRLQRNLRRRFRVGSDSNIVEIGFGMASKAGELMPSRGFCVCFYVLKKRQPRKNDIPIPKQVTVRLKSGSKFETYTLPTDVLDVPDLRPSGALLTVNSLFVDLATAGFVINWRLKSDAAKLVWGLVTVGHAFKAVTGIQGSLGDKVKVRSLSQPNSGIEGTIIWISPSNTLIDAAVIRVKSKEDLVSAGIIDQTQRPESGRIPRSINQLIADQVSPSNRTGSRGESHRNPAPFPFDVIQYFPTFGLISQLGNLSSIVYVRAVEPIISSTSHIGAVDLDFSPGTSGSGWTIQNRMSDAAIQVGTDEKTFRHGFGQAITAIFDRLKANFARDGVDVLDGSLRFVRVF